MRNVAVLALGSLREALRDRLLYSLLALGALGLTILAMMAPMTLGARDKTFHDAGLAWLHLSGFLAMLILGAWSLHREREQGIWLGILSRPVSRQEFLLGRIGGLLLVLATTLTAVGLIYLVVGWSTGVAPLPGLPQALLYVFLEMSLLAGLILLFSTFTGFAMTVLMSLLIFVAGHMAADLLRMAEMADSTLLGAVMAGCHWLLPHMEIFRVRHELVDGGGPLWREILPVIGYSLLYLSALVGLATAVFARRELR
jgi:ABC-type transport system involved in multi-copper enzyme maturation permease subunit